MTWGEFKAVGDSRIKDEDQLHWVDFDGEEKAGFLDIERTDEGKFDIHL